MKFTIHMKHEEFKALLACLSDFAESRQRFLAEPLSTIVGNRSSIALELAPGLLLDLEVGWPPPFNPATKEKSR